MTDSMDSGRSSKPNIASLLKRAAALPVGERESYLRSACSEDQALLLLALHKLKNPDETIVAKGHPTHTHDLAGTSFGRYQLLERVGEGGMGVVYKAHDRELDRDVAVKILRLDHVDATGRERFLREARATAALNHPRIVAIYDVGEHDNTPFIVMEYVRGDHLLAKPPQTLDETIDFTIHICEALEHAHQQNLIHRDLKPENVLIHHTSSGVDIKLADLGIAIAGQDLRITGEDTIAGTPSYMAPEQALNETIDARADLYSLGVMLYEWLTGRLPFRGDDALSVLSQHIHAPPVPPQSIRKDIPPALNALILRMLSKDPDSRPSSAREVLTVLSNLDRSAEATDPDLMMSGLVRGRMVGRATDLSRVQAHWQTALTGQSHLVLVSGEPGIGKTRLAREMLASARVQRSAVLMGGCYENEATTPYLPFVEALRSWVRDQSDETLRHVLQDTAAELARFAPELTARVGPFESRASLGPQEERLRLFDHFSRFLHNLAEDKGLLFFLDDLHWADSGSLSLLHYLLRQLPESKILFLGAYRELELDRAHPLAKQLMEWDRQQLATRIQLHRFDSQGTKLLVQTLLGQENPPDKFIQALHRETEGNPFFIEEIVKALIDEGAIVRNGCQWEWIDRSGHFRLPQSVKAAIGSRLEKMTDSCMQMLRVAAVLGKQFEFDELCLVLGCEDELTLDAIEQAMNAQLVLNPQSERFAFTHDKIREVLYEEMNPIRRRRIHASIAEGLEKLKDSGKCVMVEDLAHHYIEGGNEALGLKYAMEAATAARKVYAFDEALDLLSRARECAEVLNQPKTISIIDETLGDIAHDQGDLIQSTKFYERAITSVNAPEALQRVHAKAAEVYVTIGDSRGVEHTEAALEITDPPLTDALKARLKMVEARFLHLKGQLHSALEIYLSVVPLAEASQDQDLLVRLYSYISGTYQHRAEFELSNEYAERCVQIGEQHQLPLGCLLGYEFLSENGNFRGDWELAIRYGDKEETLALRVHAKERYAWSLLRGWAYLGLGQIKKAHDFSKRGIAEAQKIGEHRIELFLQLSLVDTMFYMGDIEAAETLAIKVLKECDDAGYLAHRVYSRIGLCRIYSYLRRHQEALSLAEEAWKLSSTAGLLGVLLMEGPTLARLFIESGRLNLASAVLDFHSQLADRTDAPQRKAMNGRVSGLLAYKQGNLIEARDEYLKALSYFEPHHNKLYHAHCLNELSRIERQEGNQDIADQHLKQANALYQSIGATVFC